MSLPEGYLPRKGDVLVIHVTTRYDVQDRDREEGEPIYVHVSPVGDSSYHKFRLPLADVIAIHFRNWEVGSKVRSVIDHEDTGEIAAVYDGWLWIKQPDGHMLTLHANDAEPDEIAAPPERPNPVSAAVAAGRAPTIDDIAAVVAPQRGANSKGGRP